MGAPELASFRDPSGQLVRVAGRILRLVRPEGRGDLEAFLASGRAARLVGDGRLVSTRALGAEERAALAGAGAGALAATDPALFVLEHSAVPFPSYPYEWPPEMLEAAAHLTLDLAEELLDSGFGLKDATPYNVLFDGARPVFVDLLSFERRDPGDATWLAYAQFVRTFVLPLLAASRFGLPLHRTLVDARDGLEPEELYALAGGIARLSPALFGPVTLPTWLGRRRRGSEAELYAPRRPQDPEKARFVLRVVLRGLRRSLARAAPRADRSSGWSGYMESFTYDDASFRAKETFVQEALARTRPREVLDVGCNTGHFSALAARAGARVVAIDTDPTVAGRVFRRARAEGLDVLPLRVDLSRPSPALGWRNGECRSFLARAAGRFDLALFLAVVHHLLVTERVPLAEIVDLAAELAREVVIEYVPPEDPMFRRLARGRDALHASLTRAAFEAACGRRFEVVASAALATGRVLYHLRRR